MSLLRHEHDSLTIFPDHMYTRNEYNLIKSKYGSYSSWAIWDHTRQADPRIIEKHIPELHPRYVFVGLNISGNLKSTPWLNFHGGKHDRKLKYACNDTTLRGSYITDIFKDLPEAKSSKLKLLLNEKTIEKNVALFQNEMQDIQITPNTVFILLGRPSSLLVKQFKAHFRASFSNHIICYYHYAYFRLTDKQWVEGLWEKLKMDYEYGKMLQKY